MYIHCCTLLGLLVKYGGPTYDPQDLVILSMHECISKNLIILQAETLKEKRRRAVQFSKAGLDVPEELSLFKRNGDQKISKTSDATEKVLPAEFVEPAKCENPCREHKNNIKNISMKATEYQPKMDFGVSIPEPQTVESSGDAYLLANQNIQSSTPNCSGSELNLQVINLHWCYVYLTFMILSVYNV